MGSGDRYNCNQLFDMDKAVWMDPAVDDPTEGTCYIIKAKGADEPFMAMYAAGQWFVKEGTVIESFCRWPR